MHWTSPSWLLRWQMPLTWHHHPTYLYLSLDLTQLTAEVTDASHLTAPPNLPVLVTGPHPDDCWGEGRLSPDTTTQLTCTCHWTSSSWLLRWQTPLTRQHYPTYLYLSLDLIQLTAEVTDASHLTAPPNLPVLVTGPHPADCWGDRRLSPDNTTQLTCTCHWTSPSW